jgi:hypothetical protein
LSRRRAFGLGCAVLAWAALAAAAEQPPRAVGGVRLLEAMEAAPATVVASVEATRALAGTGHAAVLRVETPVRGDVAPGARLRIAWEELAASRAPRFRKGDRVLVALEPLPGASIWRSRLPDASERSSTLAVAMRGDAFLQSPSPGSASLLEHYLVLAPADRAGADGVGYLARLAAGAEIPLATDAVARLDTRADLEAKLTRTAARQLVKALVRADAPTALQDALVELIGRHQLNALRADLEMLAAGAALAPAIVYAALARLSGGLSPEWSARLLAQAPERHRQVGARHASGDRADRDLRALIRGDPAPAVRTSAIERLVELRGGAAIAPVADALYDPESAVRIMAARQLAALGIAAVPELRNVAWATDPEAARAAVTGLALMSNAESSDALREVAAEHPDDSVRMLARVALGREVGHEHE